jgi:hypothetical protein
MSVRSGLTAVMLLAGLMLVAPNDAFAQATQAAAPKKSRDMITLAEIEHSGQKDADLLAAIRSLRPHFLEGPRGVRTMGSGMIYPLVVIVDGRKVTGLDDLVTIQAKDVKEVRYLDPNRSQNEYGTTANGGAIVVKLVSAKEKKDG